MAGPPPDLFSGRSERLGVTEKVLTLPAEGCSKRAPKWEPNSDSSDAGRRLNAREEQIWRNVWHLPQAVAWHMPEYAYLKPIVRMYVVACAVAETEQATAADRTVVLKYAEQIGLTTAGLRRLYWHIANTDTKSSAPRLHVVQGGLDPRDEWERLQEGNEHAQNE